MKKVLIFGLGNIGSEYKNTRHNIGFKILDTLADKNDIKFKKLRLADVAKFNFKGRTFILIKPATYMNLSGKAVNYWMQKENVDTNNILVVCDDLNLDFGTIRIKKKGSNGGHNGLKDIQNTLQTVNYPRLRFGVSANFSRGKQIDYVLGDWNDEENKLLKECLEKTSQAIILFGTEGFSNTMNEFNNR